LQKYNTLPAPHSAQTSDGPQENQERSSQTQHLSASSTASFFITPLAWAVLFSGLQVRFANLHPNSLIWSYLVESNYCFIFKLQPTAKGSLFQKKKEL